MVRLFSHLVMLLGFLAIPAIVQAEPPERVAGERVSLEQRLLAEPVSELAAAARNDGDAQRGAILFFQPYMSCRKCHNTDDPSQLLGPDLTRWQKPISDRQLIDAVLRPSQEIREGYESVSVLTADGRTVVGLVVQQGDPIVLRDPSQPGKLFEFERDDLDAVSKNENSLMPPSLVNQLSSRQQFLDLIRYLIEIRDGGPIAARNLKPPPHLYAARPLPEYESKIDHAGMISDLNEQSFRRGEEIYQQLCVNCHGTHNQPGSLPTSLRFASGQFKSGSDPYTMYQTLTRGFGMMQPQSWMVPQQKYDVIHYIREAYLEQHNPSQYFAVTPEWLASLPRGDSRGPRPRDLKPWVTMDYGRTLINTFEVGSDGENFAHKGIAVRLDQGPGGVSRGHHWMIFDHDTMRMAAAWSGDQFIDWKGIHFNGQHAVHPRIVGQLQAENKTGPGWAHPQSGSWQDVRTLGRDDRRYGPLPRDWAHYQGMHYHGDRTVIAYRIGDTTVLESPRLLADMNPPLYAREMEIGARSQPLTLQVAQLDSSSGKLTSLAESSVMLGPDPADSSADSNEKFRFDGNRHLLVKQASDFDMTDKSFTITARIKTKEGGSLFAKTANEASWVPDGKVWFVRGGRLAYDIGWVGAVNSRRRVDDGRWHEVALTWDHDSGRATLWIDGQRDASRVLRPQQKHDDQVIRIGYCAENFPEPQSHFVGEIESLAFFDRVIAYAPERTDTPSADAPSVDIPSAKGDAAEPLARWQLDDVESGAVLSSGKAAALETAVRSESTSSRSHSRLIAGVLGDREGLQWAQDQGRLRLTIPAGQQSRKLTIWFSSPTSDEQAVSVMSAVESIAYEAPDFDRMLAGGEPRLPQVVTTTIRPGENEGPFAVDVLTRPSPNPWLARVRLTGFDFFADGDSAAVCSWDGDVWKVSGIDSPGSQLKWRRIATGLFQPLGVRIVDGQIYITCRDQLVILRDVNDDGEIDHYVNFNNDHQVTEHFHEFAMGLQTDDDGNFYYAKSARHALKAVVPHHGTLLRVSPDGSRTDIVATGFRAANGVCLNDDGTFIVTDQEGHWNPKNRINWVHEGGFYGNMFGYHDVVDSSDDAMQPPLCWITNDFDRSPAELLWVPKDCWGPLGGSLLNLSYGYGKLFVVPHEQVDGLVQGGMCELPMPQFPTGLVRGRFHPTNGHLYTCGMFAWAGNQQQPGGFYRIRFTGKPMHVPLELSARTGRLIIKFSDPLSRASAETAENYAVQAWDLKRTANYGSKHYNQRTWKVTGASLAGDDKTVTLEIPEIAPTWGMEVRCFLESESGQPVERRIHNTIHQLGD